MSDISDRAERFVRQVFRKGQRRPEDPQKAKELEGRRDRLREARDRAVKQRKGY